MSTEPSAPRSKGLLATGVVLGVLGVAAIVAGAIWLVVYFSTDGRAPVDGFGSGNALVGGILVLLGVIVVLVGIVLTRLSRKYAP